MISFGLATDNCHYCGKTISKGEVDRCSECDTNFIFNIADWKADTLKLMHHQTTQIEAARSALQEAHQEIEYLHKKIYGNRVGNDILPRIDTALESLKKGVA